MSFFKKIFGAHSAIERFGVIFLSLMLCMGITMASIVARKVHFDNAALSGQAVYTNSFTMSLTDDVGSVKGIYSNDDQSKVFMLLKFEDMNNMPVDASKYQLFLTGSDKNKGKTELKSSPSGRLYVFGSTGYIGLYFYNEGGFESQIDKLIIRSLETFTNAGTTKDEYSDDSFNKYNQCTIFFNPGGTYATRAAFLDKKDWNVYDAYTEIISSPIEKSYRDALNADILKLNENYYRIVEYMSRVEDDGLVKPKVPDIMAGDTIYGVPKDASSSDKVYWRTTSNSWKTSSGKAYNESDLDLYLDTEKIVENGFDYSTFDWHKCSLASDSYLKAATGTDDTFKWKSFVSDHEEINSDTSELSLSDMKFYNNDGSEFNTSVNEDEEDSLTTQQKSILNDIDQLKAAYQGYYDAKVAYQQTDMLKLLNLEIEATSAWSNYSVNTGVDENGKDNRLLVLW